MIPLSTLLKWRAPPLPASWMTAVSKMLAAPTRHHYCKHGVVTHMSGDTADDVDTSAIFRAGKNQALYDLSAQADLPPLTPEEAVKQAQNVGVVLDDRIYDLEDLCTCLEDFLPTIGEENDLDEIYGYIIRDIYVETKNNSDNG